MSMITHLLRVAAILVIALAIQFLAGKVQAAPADAASEPYSLAITFNSECGAPGVGKVWSGPRRNTIEAREGRPGYRVDQAGWWAVGCTMPPPAKDCPKRKAPAWLVDGRLCHPVPGRMIPGRDAPFGHDVGTGKTFRNAGIQHWRCERWPDGVTEWRAVRAWCKPRAAR